MWLYHLWIEIVFILSFQSGCLLFLLFHACSTVLNRSGGSGHSCFIPDLGGGGSFGLSPWSVILVLVCFGRWPLLGWESSLLFLLFWVFLSQRGVGFLSNYFSASEMIMWFHPSVCKYDLSHGLICIYWRILAFLG